MRMNLGGKGVTDTNHRGMGEIIDRARVGTTAGTGKETEMSRGVEVGTGRQEEITIVSAKKEILQDAMVTLVISVETKAVTVIIHKIVMPLWREDNHSIEKKESAFKFLGKHTEEYHG
jgi:hypothetical protein